MSYPRASVRNNISKYRERWQLPCCAVQCNVVIVRRLRRAPSRLRDGKLLRPSKDATLRGWLRSQLRVKLSLLSGRIQQPGSRRRPSVALTRSRWTAPPSVVAALQAFGLQPTEPALVQASFHLAGQTAMSGARNPLPDWQAPDSAAPAADNIRRIWPTTCFWPTSRIWPPAHDNAAPSLCDQPSPVRREQGDPTLLGGLAMGQGSLWISARRRARNQGSGIRDQEISEILDARPLMLDI